MHGTTMVFLVIMPVSVGFANYIVPLQIATRDVAFPRLNDVIEYCDKFPLDDLPEDARTLMHLMQSLVMVSFPIEAWKQPRVPDSGAAWVELIREPVI